MSSIKNIFPKIEDINPEKRVKPLQIENYKQNKKYFKKFYCSIKTVKTLPSKEKSQKESISPQNKFGSKNSQKQCRVRITRDFKKKSKNT